MIEEALQWHVDRELPYKPKHFIVATTPVTVDSLMWIAHRLVGRYHIVTGVNNVKLTQDPSFPAFEDPAEAMLYELTWS